MSTEAGKASWSNRALAVAGVLGTLLGAPLGWFGGDFMSYRSEVRAADRQAFADLIAAQKSLAATLQPYADLASGRSGEISSFNALRTDIRNVNGQAQLLTNRIPIASKAFDEYSDSLIELQKAAEGLKSPYSGGKKFVQAMSTFIARQNAFASIIQKHASRFL